MTITDVRIRKIAAEGKMKAIVSITFDNEFVVHDIKIIEGQNGLFIAMPSRKTPDGEFKDIAHPINTDTREKIQSSILKAYECIGGLRKNEYFKTWLIKIVINQCYEICRKNRRVIFLNNDASINQEKYVDTYENLDLKRALDSLEDDLKIVVELYYYEDFLLKDIAKILEIPEGTLKSRLSRARKKLYSILKED